jgi:NitT/TauT family transport system substrate-binding protein/putative hydroxymethylpyrimidine transport system substrate-binding protein
MRRVVALLAAVLASAALTACGDDGAEPGALRSATLVLDFQPNAVHTGIYSALERGYYRDAGIDLRVQEPSASTDAPKLLEAGRADFAILDIHDLGLARERGLDLVGIAPIVQRPLASVLVDPTEIRRPRDLEGRTVGVTGLPSDDAVLDSVLEADGADPQAVDRVTIGFNAVGSLAAGRVDAATGFWNAEALELQRRGVPTYGFRVDDYGAPRYPELVLVTSRELIETDRDLAASMALATARGYDFTVSNYRSRRGRSGASLSYLLRATSGLDRDVQREQLDALMTAHAFEPPGRFQWRVLRAWARWDADHGILAQPVPIGPAFDQVRIGGSA